MYTYEAHLSFWLSCLLVWSGRWVSRQEIIKAINLQYSLFIHILPTMIVFHLLLYAPLLRYSHHTVWLWLFSNSQLLTSQQSFRNCIEKNYIILVWVVIQLTAGCLVCLSAFWGERLHYIARSIKCCILQYTVCIFSIVYVIYICKS